MLSAVSAAVLTAALLHAAWNAIAHAITDRLVAFTLIQGAATVVTVVALPFVPVPDGSAWVFLVASAATHQLYNLGLMQSYRLGDFNQVYPLARGTSPWVVAIVATAVLGEHLPPLHLLGVIVVSAGLAILVFAGGVPARGTWPALAAAFATGLTIAGYTVLDGVGVRHSGSALGYTAWLFLLESPLIPAYALITRGGRTLMAQARPSLLIGLSGGLFSVGAYGLVLWAQTRGALAAIAALRETSIIFGAIIGAVAFKEGFGRVRLVATVVVVAGIIALNV